MGFKVFCVYWLAPATHHATSDPVNLANGGDSFWFSADSRRAKSNVRMDSACRNDGVGTGNEGVARE